VKERVRAIKNLTNTQMPYDLVKIGGKFAVKSTAGPNKGKLHGLTTKPKAEAQKRLLEMIMMRGKKK
jgi:membrane-associated PAP2 superfamily phosphatase